jgi:mono/diheme cytochrome c family protein
MRRDVIGPMVLAGALLLAIVPAGSQDRDALPKRGEQLFVSQGCYGCHQVGKFGTPIGPDLSRVGAKYPASYLTEWVRDPESVRPSAHMPKLELSPEDLRALAAYLASLK